MKNWVPVIRKHAPYRIEPAISKAQNVVHVWASTFQKSLGTILEELLDLHFKGASLHKTDSLTVLITYSFAVCVNILQYHTVLQYYCPLTPPRPFRSYKMKTQPHTHRF